MAKVVNDPKELPVSIFQVELSRVPFLTIELLDKITKKIQAKGGIKKNNYYLLPTEGNISWLQPTPELGKYHRFLRLLKTKKGFHYLMIINDKQDV
jgi:hypothetical protein